VVPCERNTGGPTLDGGAPWLDLTTYVTAAVRAAPVPLRRCLACEGAVDRALGGVTTENDYQIQPPAVIPRPWEQRQNDHRVQRPVWPLLLASGFAGRNMSEPLVCLWLVPAVGKAQAPIKTVGARPVEGGAWLGWVVWGLTDGSMQASVDVSELATKTQ
jgi:hypothetical protein